MLGTDLLVPWQDLVSAWPSGPEAILHRRVFVVVTAYQSILGKEWSLVNGLNLPRTMRGRLLFPSLGQSVEPPYASRCLHHYIYGDSAQEAVKPGRAPWPQVGSMEHDAERDMPSDAQA